MRLIEFRGKSKETGKYVYGNLIVDKENEKYYILKNMKDILIEVEEETIGQFVNENQYGKLYEGMKLYDEYNEENCTLVYDEIDNEFCLEYEDSFKKAKAYNLDGMIILGN